MKTCRYPLLNVSAKCTLRSLMLGVCLTSLMHAAEEPFDYLDGAALAGQSGGTGWAIPWSPKNGNTANHANINVVADSLTYPGLVTSGNKTHCFWTNTGSGSASTNTFRNLQTPLGTGTHYIRILAQKVGGGNRFFGLALFPIGGSEKALIGQSSGYSNWTINRVLTDEVFPPGHQNEGQLTNTLTSSVPTTTQALLVVKLELREPSLDNLDGLDRITYWVNPDLSLPEDVSTAVGGQTYTTSVDYETIGRVRVGGGGFNAAVGGDAANHYLDEIHFDSYPPFAHGRIVVKEPAATELTNGASTTDFGTVLINQPQTRTYTVRNIGPSTLNDFSVAVTDGQFTDFVAGNIVVPSLAPNAETTFDVTFTPSALGSRSATLTIGSNDPINGTFTVALVGVGAAPVIVVEQPEGSPLTSGVSSTAFGASPVGVAVPALTYKIKNTGGLPLEDLTASVGGGTSTDFVVSMLSVDELAPDAETSFTVTFTPGALGPRATTLTIASNDPANNHFTVALTGSGGVPQIVVEQPDDTPLQNGVSSVEFGGVRLLDPPAQRVFIVRNDGAATLSNLTVDVSGAHEDDFVESNLGTTTSLAPNEEISLTVSFNPTALGARTATLTLTSDDPDDDPFVVSLSGTGLGNYGHSKAVTTPDTESAPPDAANVPWDDDAVGLYDGLLRADSDGETLLGAVESLKLVKAKPGSGLGGAASGKLRLNGRTVSLRGTFDTDGLLAATLAQTDGSQILLNLRLMRTLGTLEEVIRGTITWDGVTARADLPRAPFHARDLPAPALWSGKFTLLLPVSPDRQPNEPGGDGWATVIVSPAGGVRLVGALGDGVKWTESAFLSADGTFSLFSELYRSAPKGRVGGRLVFRDVPDVSDFDGKIQWVKLADIREVAYPGGFTLERWAVGSRFTPPATGSYILPGLVAADPNASVSLWGSLLSSLEQAGAISRVASWKTNHQLQHYGPEKLLAQANKNTGTVTGSFLSLAGGKPLALRGVVLQKQDLAGGGFVVAGGSGLLRVQPGTDYPFPGSEDPGPLAELEAPAAPAAPLTAVGVTLASTSAFVGVYGGILSDDTGAPIGALENIKLSATGAFSLTLWQRGVKSALSGTLDANGKVTGLPVPGTSLTLDLRLEQITPSGSFVLRGELHDGALTFDIDSQIRPVHSSAAPSTHRGVYTLAVLSPGTAPAATEPAGHGYGTLKVSPTGLATGALALADGSKTTFAGHVTYEGEWSFHRGLYGKVPQGYLAGKLTFRNEAGVSDVDGDWTWVKNNAAPPTTVYPTGFDMLCQVVGSAYVKPVTGQRAITSVADDFYNTWARLEGVNMAATGLPQVLETSRAVTWNAKNKILYYGTDKFTLLFNTTTGVVTGSYQDKARGINVKGGGALLQKQSLAPGFYLHSGQSGRFFIEPRQP